MELWCTLIIHTEFGTNLRSSDRQSTAAENTGELLRLFICFLSVCVLFMFLKVKKVKARINRTSLPMKTLKRLDSRPAFNSVTSWHHYVPTSHIYIIQPVFVVEVKLTKVNRIRAVGDMVRGVFLLKKNFGSVKPKIKLWTCKSS